MLQKDLIFIQVYYENEQNRTLLFQPPSSPEEPRVDKSKMLDVEGIRKLAAGLGMILADPHKRSEELSDEELERRRNALLQQLHEEAD